jgi:hypothetical protein
VDGGMDWDFEELCNVLLLEGYSRKKCCRQALPLLKNLNPIKFINVQALILEIK